MLIQTFDYHVALYHSTYHNADTELLYHTVCVELVS